MEGYPRLAHVLYTFPELASFRTFERLNNESLLLRQADLNWDELQIEALREDLPVGQPLSWEDMKSADDESTAGQLRLKFEELETKLRLFRSDLLQTAQIQRLKPATNLTRQSLRDWLSVKGGGQGFITGVEARPWQINRIKDVVSVSLQPEKLDLFFMRILMKPCHKLLRRWKKPVTDEEKALGKLWSYEEKHFVRTADAFCVLASALVPSASMVAMCFVHDTLDRMILIITFALVFAAVVLFCFDCGRANTFGATVAFAAVQVVFIQGVDKL